MKVMIVAHGHPTLHKGGGEVAAYSLHRLLREQGHHSIFVGWGGQANSANGGSLTQVGEDDYLLFTETEHFHFSSTSGHLKEAFEVLLAAYQPDVVHFHHYLHIGIEGASFIKKISPKTRVVMTLHEYLAICANNGQFFTKKNEVCMGYGPERCVSQCFPHIKPAAFFLREITIKSAFSYIDTFISPSAFLAEQYKLWGIPKEKITVIENPLPPIAAFGEAGLVGPVVNGKWHLGFFGQINFYKGVDVIIESIRLARERKVQVEVGIHGNFSDVTGGAYLDRLKAAIDSLGAAAVFHGPYRQSDVTSLMQQYHWIVMGSRWYENSPVVIQEALAAGVPLIVPNHGGMKEKISGAGLFFQPGNAASLAHVLTTITPATHAHLSSEIAKASVQRCAANQKNLVDVVRTYE